MKPGCFLDLFLTGVILYPKPKIRFGIMRVKPLKDEIQELINAGAQHIELASDVIQFTPHFRKKFQKEMPHLKKQMESFDIIFSVHIDHIGYCFPARSREMRAGTNVRFERLVEYYKSLKPAHYTLHLGPDVLFEKGVIKGSPSPRIPSLKNFFKRFKILKETGVRAITIEELLRVTPKALERLKESVDLKKIYIENVEGMTRREFDALFGPLSKKFPELGCILDTGHLLVEEYLENKNCLEDFVRYWGGKKNKIKAIHCHDVVIEPHPVKKDLLIEVVRSLEQRKDETLNPEIEKLRRVIKSIEALSGVLVDHQPLGTGTGILNLPSLLEALNDIGDFKGPIIFEPSLNRGTIESVKFLTKEIEKIKQISQFTKNN